MTGSSDTRILSERDAPVQGFCRDCDHILDLPGNSAASAMDRCPRCHSPRVVMAPGLFALTVAHVDCDAFFANIEKRDRPDLRDKPVVVGGVGDRGVVAAACYLARTWGIRSAMPMVTARRLCPDLVVLPPDREKYAREGARIAAMMHEITPLVERISIDEAFLDLSGTERLHGVPPALILARLARRVERETGLTISIGLSFNKFLAKMASDLDKPRGFAVIDREGAQDFLDGLKVEELWGVGPAAARTLKKHGITTVRSLRERDKGWLLARFGKWGLHLYEVARGIDPRPVVPYHEPKSISAETTFAEDVADARMLKATLWHLSRKVMKRALKKGKGGHVVMVKVRLADFETHTAQTHLNEPTLLAGRIFAAALPLMERLRQGRACRLIGCGIAELVDMDEAMLTRSLDARAEKQARAELAMERLRARFGSAAIDKGLGLSGKRID